jgi:hypothetical protein
LLVGRITVASDCLDIVKGLHGQHLGACNHILLEIKETPDRRGETSFCHEGCHFNTEAHLLAQYVSSLPAGRHMWLNIKPEGLDLHVNVLDHVE